MAQYAPWVHSPGYSRFSTNASPFGPTWAKNTSQPGSWLSLPNAPQSCRALPPTSTLLGKSLPSSTDTACGCIQPGTCGRYSCRQPNHAGRPSEPRQETAASPADDDTGTVSERFSALRRSLKLQPAGLADSGGCAPAIGHRPKAGCEAVVEILKGLIHPLKVRQSITPPLWLTRRCNTSSPSEKYDW